MARAALPPCPMPSAPNDHRDTAAPPPRAPVPAAVLLALLAVWLLATLGLRPLLLPDEGRYTGVARAMLHGGSWDTWLVPTLDGLPFFHKPPLFYWLDMAAMQLLGTHAFTARIASMLGAWLMGASLYFAVRRWHGARAATITLGVLATCPFYFIGAQYANHDMLVGGLITAAVLAFARALDTPPRVQLGWLVAAWVACAFAMLAKGLIGFVLPALVIGPWLLAQGRWREMFRLLHPLGLLAFVAVAAPWFVAMQMRYPGFFDYFVMEQHFRRFAQSNFNNVHPFWFFIVVMPALTLPWSAWLPQAAQRTWAQRDARIGLCFWWLVAVVGFFSLPSSKLVGYVLPALAPWCALLALAIVPGRARVWPWVMGASALVCVAIVVAFAWQAPKSNRAAALALAAQMAPGDRVVMVDEYFYDLPFYARLTAPVIIASDWADPALPTRDNWRKELFDATRFDPALGRELLRPLDRLDALLCGAGTAWFVVDPGRAQRVAALAGSTRAFADSRTELWRAPMHACP
jgi:4-amino-4-deoxy-L-arabinose transferase-like glycosyltransferase